MKVFLIFMAGAFGGELREVGRESIDCEPVLVTSSPGVSSPAGRLNVSAGARWVGDAAGDAAAAAASTLAATFPATLAGETRLEDVDAGDGTSAVGYKGLLPEKLPIWGLHGKSFSEDVDGQCRSPPRCGPRSSPEIELLDDFDCAVDQPEYEDPERSKPSPPAACAIFAMCAGRFTPARQPGVYASASLHPQAARSEMGPIERSHPRDAPPSRIRAETCS